MSDVDTDSVSETDNMSEEERKMMEEWGAMADEDGGDTDVDFEEPPEDEMGDDDMAAAMGMEEDGEARILNQDEIDSLLGFGDEDGGPDKSGLRALVNSAMVNYERLPMLDVVFDRLVRLMSTSIRNLTSDNVEISLDQITSVRFGDYLNSIPLPAMLSVFKAEEWDNYALMTVDSALIYSIVDVLLGGRRGNSAMRVEGRPYTTIEIKLVERMVTVILGDLSSAFDPLSPVTFRQERIETNPRFAAITQGNNACVLINLRVDMGDRGGRVEILIPYATLEPVRELLLQMFMGEKFGRDSIWETHLTNELLKTTVEIDAVLGEATVSLYDVINWKEGSRLVLDAFPEDPVEMRCGDFAMFTAQPGQKRGKLAAKILNDITKKKKENKEAQKPQ